MNLLKKLSVFAKFSRQIFTRNRQSLIFLTIAIIFWRCAKDTTESDSEKLIQPGTAKTSDQLTALDNFIGQDKNKEKTLKDIRLIFLAMTQENPKLGGHKGSANAVKSWFEALTLAQGSFGEVAFDGWVKAYVFALDRKSDETVLARLILAETKQGTVSPYMREVSLSNEAKVIKKLRDLVPEWITTTEEARYLGPKEAGIPAHDPLLLKTAKELCHHKHPETTSWKTWKDTLPTEIRTYFEGLSAQCSGQAEKALKLLVQSYQKLEQSPSTHPLAIEAASRSATIQRNLGLRLEAADTYLYLMKLWENSSVNYQSMGMGKFEFEVRKINDILWSARYRAMIADYENAKIFGQNAITGVAQSLAALSLSKDQRKELADLQADAYHTLAYRIAVERREYESAVSLSILGLQSSYISQEWKDRLSWLAGLYDYINENIASARHRWKNQLEGTQDPSLRPMLLFWLARVEYRLGNQAESRAHLSELLSNYPLSYYATIAPEIAGLKSHSEIKANLRKIFGSPDALRAKTLINQSVNIAPLAASVRSSKILAPLLLRAEALLAVGDQEWATKGVSDFEHGFENVRGGQEEADPAIHETAAILLTRLHYATANYLKAITVTTKLAKKDLNFWRKWPEQLLIYYPVPYLDDYRQSSTDQGVDIEILLAISRQESGFTPIIKSSANALGMMQLIRPTALRFAKELGIPKDDLEEALNQPATNIRIGARYLKVLLATFKKYQPAVYGGYNAGEGAVNIWLTRRSHSDPLIFTELIPFGETKDYVKNVWRNNAIYDYLLGPHDNSAAR